MADWNFPNLLVADWIEILAFTHSIRSAHIHKHKYIIKPILGILLKPILGILLKPFGFDLIQYELIFQIHMNLTTKFMKRA